MFSFGFFVIVCLTIVSSYHNINVDEVIGNERLMKSYIDCLLEKGQCTSDGEQMKKDIPDALQTDCVKCNDKDKSDIIKVAKYLTKNKPDWWKQLQAKFDPQAVYKKKYQELLVKEGISY